MWFIGGCLVGLIVGWNFLEQPSWVKKKVDNARSRVG